MQFIRNILIIGENSAFQTDFKDSLELINPKINAELVFDRTTISKKLADFSVNSVFINLKDVSEALYAFRLLTMYKMKTNPKLKIYFTSEDFGVFQSVVSQLDPGSVDVFPWPIDKKQIAHQITDEMFDKRLSKEIVTKDKNVLKVDLEFIQVFIEATKGVLSEMGQVTDLVHKKPIFKDKMEKEIEPGISSRIMISSHFFTGNFYVIFPKSSFLKLYANAVFEECSEINEDNQDFAGELANIIYGQTKKVLSLSGLNLDMVIPSIHRSTNIDSEFVIITPFTSSIGDFYIAVAPGAI